MACESLSIRTSTTAGVRGNSRPSHPINFLPPDSCFLVVPDFSSVRELALPMLPRLFLLRTGVTGGVDTRTLAGEEVWKADETFLILPSR